MPEPVGASVVRLGALVVVGLAFGLPGIGCGAKSGKASDASNASDSSDSSRNGDTPAESDGGSGDVCASGPISSAPAQWVRPTNCGGVGNLCSEGCGSAACQLVGNVCIPFAGVGASPTSCAPYCAAFACMTYDQAACFCTGSAAVQNSACACGPPALAGLCASEGGSCANAPCCACQGLRCVVDSVSGTVCRQPCSTNQDCATGCCNTTAGVCQDQLYCNCVGVGATCAGGGPDCCPGTTCLTFAAAASGPFTCFKDCTAQGDCTSSTCCSQTIQGLTHGACGPCQ